jgi:hypothetical protein
MVTFTESATLDTSTRVNKHHGVIYGVRVLGAKSLNGRTYAADAMQAAVGLYEGAKVNIDHPRGRSQTRDLSSRFGELRNVRFARGGLDADLHYIKSHKLADFVTEAAERMPSKLGLSHNVEGQTSRRNGEAIVERITRVFSVDLVADPATTTSLFESQGRMIQSNYPSSLKEFISQLKTQPMGLYQARERALREGVVGDIPTPGYEPLIDDGGMVEQIRKIIDSETSVSTKVEEIAYLLVNRKNLQANPDAKRISSSEIRAMLHSESIEYPSDFCGFIRELRGH